MKRRFEKQILIENFYNVSDFKIKKYNASDFQTKFSQRVRFWTEKNLTR